MIFVHDKGRMANNMLQYGHVYAWGRAHGRTTMSMRFAYKYPWFQICEDDARQADDRGDGLVCALV